jgi:hypothetical protein
VSRGVTDKNGETWTGDIVGVIMIVLLALAGIALVAFVCRVMVMA